MPGDKHARKIGWMTASSLVIANMVGTGAFTTLGLQLAAIHNTWSIILLWLLGGVIALCGALSYSELSVHLPRSGGEYHFLSSTMHPMVGYLAGWVSLTVGFSASISLAAMAMGHYMSKFVFLSPGIIALGAILLMSLIHSFDLRHSSVFQNGFTVIKLSLMLGLILAGLCMSAGSSALNWDALIYVTYAYSGWNAAAYIVEEIRQPRRNMPIALLGGTLLVSVLYIFLQLAFLRQASAEELTGRVEVGQIVAEKLFGPSGGLYISLAIAFVLLASISAMIWVGPRVTKAIARDYSLWRFLGVENAGGIPVRAVWLQAVISISLILSGSFEAVLLYSGFVLQLSTTLTVASVFIIRRRATPGSYRAPGFPWIQLFYLAASGWILIFLLIDRPLESLLGMGNLLAGAATYALNRRREKDRAANDAASV
jgi:APA family basic amino acid/polyamine antiporter